MKKYLKSSGIVPYLIISLCLALMLVSKAVYYKYQISATEIKTYFYYGKDVLYEMVGGYEPSVAAICALTFLTMASTILPIGALIPLFKKDRPLTVFSGVLNLASMALIFAAAICILCIKSDWSFIQENDYVFHLAGGYVFICVLSFLASALCLPSVIACFKKDKLEE